MSKRTIIDDLKSGRLPVYEARKATGHKLLTLSYRPSKGFRYYKGSRPGGGGRKHTPCTESEARTLLKEASHYDIMNGDKLLELVLADTHRVIDGMEMNPMDREFYLCGIEHGAMIAMHHLRHHLEQVKGDKP